MRIWSIHPKYLDSRGLTALWRESLLARKVLKGKTRGYRNHPQLERFRARKDPVSCMNAYLLHVHRESCSRGFCFDRKKLERPVYRGKIPVTEGQVLFELKHLKAKLRKRDPKAYGKLLKVEKPEPHPLFTVKPGPVEDWEKGKQA